MTKPGMRDSPQPGHMMKATRKKREFCANWKSEKQLKGWKLFKLFHWTPF